MIGEIIAKENGSKIDKYISHPHAHIHNITPTYSHTYSRIHPYTYTCNMLS